MNVRKRGSFLVASWEYSWVFEIGHCANVIRILVGPQWMQFSKISLYRAQLVPDALLSPSSKPHVKLGSVSTSATNVASPNAGCSFWATIATIPIAKLVLLSFMIFVGNWLIDLWPSAWGGLLSVSLYVAAVYRKERSGKAASGVNSVQFTTDLIQLDIPNISWPMVVGVW